MADLFPPPSARRSRPKSHNLKPPASPSASQRSSSATTPRPTSTPRIRKNPAPRSASPSNFTQLPDTASDVDLHNTIQFLNYNTQVTGIFLHSPLPAGLDLQTAQYKIDILKDVEGVNPANLGHVVYGHTIIAPCTAQAVVELIDSTGVPLEGANVTVVGASRIVGRPLSLLLTERNATVTLCHIHTKDTPAACKNADILVVAVGKPKLVLADHVKPGAVVIDVGINRVNDKTVGDVDFENVSKIASHITPVPGGVGPMTVAMLLKNTLRAAKLVHHLEKPFGSH